MPYAFPTHANGDVINASIVNDIQTAIMVLSKRVFHLFEYGAVGDGIANDTTALVNAVNAAHTAGGGVVVAPAGTYMLDGPSFVGKNKVTILGAGHKATLFKLRPTRNVPVMTFENCYWLTLRDFGIDGNQAAQTADTTAGLQLYMNPLWDFEVGAPDFDPDRRIENITIQFVRGDGMRVTGRSMSHFTGCWVDDVYGIGYSLDNGGGSSGADNVWNHCTASNTGLHGWKINGSQNRVGVCKAYWTGRRRLFNSGHGFYLTNPARGVSLVGCEAQDCNDAGYMLEGVRNVSLVGCNANSNSVGGWGNYPGFSLWDVTRSQVIACTSSERYTGTAHNWAAPTGIDGPTQMYAIQVRKSGGTHRDNWVDVTHDYEDGSAIPNPPIEAPSNAIAEPGNRIWVNGTQYTANL